jgi:hypothetical protein
MTNRKYITYIVFPVILIVVVSIILILVNHRKNISGFVNTPSEQMAKLYVDSYKPYSTMHSAPVDRTQLYGSIFLENINQSIKNMTDPKLKYEETTMKLTDYQDVIA